MSILSPGVKVSCLNPLAGNKFFNPHKFLQQRWGGLMKAQLLAAGKQPPLVPRLDIRHFKVTHYGK